ncbi:hypothetical protein MMC29_000135 [Sticta canariensis]|nr:hypothetical protein [Sticta canariensis]
MKLADTRFRFPLTFLLQRFHHDKALGCMVVFWSVIAMLTAAITSWQGMFIQRFFLGIVESIVPPTFMCIVTGYYTQEEQTLRQSWWYSVTAGFVIIGDALNYGFAQISSECLHRWQCLYLLTGALTALFSAFCFASPGSAASARFLTVEQ